MSIPRPRYFFDTSVYIAALLSPRAVAGELIRLAESGVIGMVVSEQVVVESDDVLGKKFPSLIGRSRELWKYLKPHVVQDPPVLTCVQFSACLAAGDALILCAASRANVAAFVTWNTRDFLKPAVAKLVPFPILIPGDALKFFRQSIAPYLE